MCNIPIIHSKFNMRAVQSTSDLGMMTDVQIGDLTVLPNGRIMVYTGEHCWEDIRYRENLTGSVSNICNTDTKVSPKYSHCKSCGALVDLDNVKCAFCGTVYANLWN